MLLFRNMNRDCIAGPKKLSLGLLVGLALSIGGCPKQSALRESSSGSALVLFRGVQLGAVSALSVDTLLLSEELGNMSSMHGISPLPP